MKSPNEVTEIQIPFFQSGRYLFLSVRYIINFPYSLLWSFYLSFMSWMQSKVFPRFILNKLNNLLYLYYYLPRNIGQSGIVFFFFVNITQ